MAAAILLAIAVAIARVVTAEVSRVGGLAASLPLLQRIEASGAAICFYVEKLATAFPILFVEPRWGLSDSRWMALAGVGLLAVLVTLWLIRKRLGRGAFTAMALLAVLLIPVTPLVRQEWTRLSYVGDQLQYLPGIAIIALLASMVTWLIEAVARGGMRSVLRAVVGLVILTARISRHVDRQRSLRQRDRAAPPRSRVWPGALASRGELALALLRRGENLQAASCFDGPTVARMNAMAGRGAPMLARRRRRSSPMHRCWRTNDVYSEAVAVYRSLIAVDPGNQEVRLRLGQVYAAQRGQGPRAGTVFRRASQVAR